MNKPFIRSITDVPCLSLLQRCSSMDELKEIHAHTITHGLARFAFTASKLLAFSSLTDYADLTYANTLFDQILNPNVFDFNSMIMGFAKSSRPEMGVGIYGKMRRSDAEPNARTFSILVKACFGLSMVGQVHGQVVKFGHECDVYVVSSLISGYSKYGAMEVSHRVFEKTVEKNVVCWTSLVSGYCANGLVDEGRKIFDEIPERNDVCYSAMVSGYVQNGCFNEAIEMFRELKRTCCHGIKLKGSLLVSVLNACASVGAFEEGKWIHMFLDQNGFECGLELGTALIDFYSKCGSIREAQEIFIRMPNKDVTIWSAMIAGLAVNGENNSGIELFAKMEREGPKPNAVTLIGVLTACNHETLANKAWWFFGRMSKVYGISPLIEHYGCMVDLLARSGRTKDAEILVRTMPMEPDGAIWGSLLNGYLMQGRTELAEMVGNILIRLEPQHCGRYVLLANTYAKMGKWIDVTRVRKIMKVRDVAKYAAWSFVEIGGVVHKFVADDKSHPQLRNVYSVLGQLRRVFESSSLVNINNE